MFYFYGRDANILQVVKLKCMYIYLQRHKPQHERGIIRGVRLCQQKSKILGARNRRRRRTSRESEPAANYTSSGTAIRGR